MVALEKNLHLCNVGRFRLVLLYTRFSREVVNIFRFSFKKWKFMFLSINWALNDSNRISCLWKQCLVTVCHVKYKFYWIYRDFSKHFQIFFPNFHWEFEEFLFQTKWVLVELNQWIGLDKCGSTWWIFTWNTYIFSYILMCIFISEIISEYLQFLRETKYK